MSNDMPAPEAMKSKAAPDPELSIGGMSYKKRDYEGVLVRLLSPLGDYPIGTINHRGAAMVIRPDLSALITTFEPVEEPEDYYSEIEYLSQFEIRALASILLSLRGDLAFLGLYPAPYAMERRYIGVDLSDAATVNKLMDEFAAFVRRVPLYQGEMHRPPLIGGLAYSYDDGSRLEHERQLDIFDSIDVSDHLMMRGLGALVRAIMLERFTEFLESSAMSLYVAMEASMEIVKEIVCAEGNENPTAKDAGRFLDRIFGCEWEAEGYFEEYYEDRIKIIHPASSFGVFPGAALGVDDVWGLRRSLVHLYDFLVTGNVKEEMKWRSRTPTVPE